MISFLAPILSVVFGVAIVLLYSKSKPLNLKLFLAFSGAFLLSTTIFELLPEVYQNVDTKQIGVFIMGGILLQILLEFYSKGAEHGHLHHHDSNKRFPWFLFISLGIHAFFEGFPLKDHHNIIIGVVIHKIPIAILITTYLLKSKLPKSQVVLFLIIFTLMTPLGSIAAELFSISPTLIYSINAIVIGMFLHISTIILFESSEGHHFNLNKILMIISAVVLAYFI
ncbi:zinc transporter, ZIP family [Formosa sp. Hel1_33_131]|jgi:zinc transporter ZupT|uniref:ZIP family metal transporter n=1 Tax=Formosa sp. Hel1_33_131 TaxID=1336794 RepID=UPI00084E2E8C|nr:ZIP family metal transporter [Formosa sp. Hel1_33_131]AOR29680.1 zinc transporter, ZIP family [Formosa sp. Hel1_33_131]